MCANVAHELAVHLLIEEKHPPGVVDVAAWSEKPGGEINDLHCL